MNGVPDRWEGTGYVYGFVDANHDGFPDGLAFPEAGNGNFDIEVTVTTTRSALLSWGSSTNEAVVLPPCAGLAVRLRLTGGVDTDVRLSCCADGAAADGLWRAGLSASWPAGRSQEVEGNRVRLGDGTVVDCDDTEASFRGEAGTASARSRGGAATSISCPFRRKLLEVVCASGLCWEHDPHGYCAVATYTNVAPPFAWYVDGVPVPGEHGDRLGGFEIFRTWRGWESPVVRCVATNGPPHEAILVEGEDGVALGHCPPGITNIYAITTLEGYDAVTNHAPKFETTPIRYGEICPEVVTLDIWAGFAHGGEKPRDRNFETIPTGDPLDDQTSHCHAIDWAENLTIDLEEYLPAWLLEYRDGFHYRVNGTDIVGSEIEAGKEAPDDLLPDIYHVEMRNDANATLDRLWIVVLNPGTRTEFGTWVTQNSTNATWLTKLPKPPSKIIVDEHGNATLPATAKGAWSEPTPISSYMHPKAVYELRAGSIFSEHGHQATYDADGNVITESIKAGTADFASPYRTYMLLRLDDHRVTDVKPYIQALQLDGNPVLPIDSSGNISAFWTRDLTRPPLRVGPFTQQYLQRRPTTPTGVLNIP